MEDPLALTHRIGVALEEVGGIVVAVAGGEGAAEAGDLRLVDLLLLVGLGGQIGGLGVGGADAGLIGSGEGGSHFVQHGQIEVEALGGHIRGNGGIQIAGMHQILVEGTLQLQLNIGLGLFRRKPNWLLPEWWQISNYLLRWPLERWRGLAHCTEASCWRSFCWRLDLYCRCQGMGTKPLYTCSAVRMIDPFARNDIFANIFLLPTVDQLGSINAYA